MAGPFVDPTVAAPAAAPRAAAAPSAYSPEDGKVVIRDQDGSVSQIAAGDLSAAVREGARPASESEYYGAKTGAVGQASAGYLGFARGLTFGFGDPAMIEATRALRGDEAAEDARRVLNLSKEAFPGATLGGEIGGALAPLALGLSPGGAAAEGAGYFGRALAATESGLGRAAIRAAEAAPGAIGEGAIAGVGAQASEDALAGNPFAVSAYIQSGLKGGAIGALIGAGTSAGIGALADRFAPRFGRAAEELAERPSVRATEEAAGAGERRGLLSRLEEQGNVSAYRAAGAGKADFRRLGLTVDEQTSEAARLGRRVQDVVEGQGETLATTSQAKLAKMLAKETNDVGADLGRMRKALDEKGIERPSVRYISQQFKAEVWPQIREAFPLKAAEELKQAEDWISRMGQQADRDGKLSFDGLYRMRKEIEGAVDYTRASGAAVPVGEEATKALRNIVENEFTRAAEKASAEAGQEFASKYRIAKESYSDLVALKEIAEKKAAGDAAGSAIHFKDLLFGSLAAAATGQPVAMLAPIGAKLGREYGNQILSYGIGKVAKLRAVASASEEFDQALNRGAKEIFSGKSAKVADKTLSGADVRAIRSALTTPEQVESRVSEAIGDLSGSTPKLAAAVAAKLTRAAAYIRDNLPREEPPSGGLLQARAPLPIPESKLRAASQMIEAIDSPEIIFERLKQGRLTNAHVRALEAVHPEAYARMQNYIAAHVGELRRSLTVQEEVKLSLLFKRPINETMKVANIAAFQQVFLPPEPSKESKGVGSNVANIGKIASGSRATQWDKQEAGEA